IAFPGADGYGKYVSGGRGGRVLYVTNLNDAGAGSLRSAIADTGARIVLFKISGTIALQSELSITHDNLTIAGQSAPGDGICIRNYSVQIRASNVIVRFIRFRLGDEARTQDDALGGTKRSDIIIDHCSMSWSTDECASFYGNKNFTMQWCFMSESLNASVHEKGAHGYGGIWGGEMASFHHNLLAHHSSRNPRFCGSRYTARPDDERVDFRNNVIYNWGGNSGYAGEGGSYNMVNNYYRSGAATQAGKVSYRIFSPNCQSREAHNKQISPTWGKFWLSGNVMHHDDATTADNWRGFQPNTNDGDLPHGSIDSIKLSGEFSVPEQSLTHSARDAYNLVVAYGGASLARDSVDVRVANEVANGLCTYRGSKSGTAGLIDSQRDVGGWPQLHSLPAPPDTDNDGIPDTWEQAHNLNPSKASDGNDTTLNAPYTNLEVYLNSLVDHIIFAQQKTSNL
ncbi:MAG: pectate lyase, partial [Prevotellaceae bacterium]|nr:pectate lyase [Prevotellaceae bacterium]